MPLSKKIKKPQNECMEKGIYKKIYNSSEFFDEIQYDYDYMLDRKIYLTYVTHAIHEQIKELEYIHRFNTCNEIILRDVYMDGKVFRCHELLLGITMHGRYKINMFSRLGLAPTIDKLNEWLNNPYYTIELVTDLPISVDGYKYILKLKW